MAAETNQLALVTTEAVVVAPFHKAWMKRIVKGVGKRQIQEVLAENGKRKEDVESQLREAQILQTACEADVNKTEAEVLQASQVVEQAIRDELDAARSYGKLKIDREGVSSKKLALRNQLLEEQKKLAMLEVLAASHAKLKEIKRQQVAATKAAEKAAEDAKEFVMARKRLLKEVAEATRLARAGLNEQKSSRRSHAFRRAVSSKWLLRASTYCVEEPSAKYPRRAVTYDIEESQAEPKHPSLKKDIDDIPAHEMDDVPTSPCKRSEAMSDEVPPTLIQPSLSRRPSLHAQLALARSATETLQEDAQPYGSL
jgi:hypothetical protein